MSKHSPINTSILYWGTPVVLITTTNPDGTPNIAPMSSAWWLGDIAMLGLEASSRTTQNLLRTHHCVLNLPTSSTSSPVNKLAKTTGTPIVPESKLSRGYTHVKDKFALANLTPEPSDLVTPPRIAECPVQMEAELISFRHLSIGKGEAMRGFSVAVEVRVLRTYVVDELRLDGYENRIDAEAWRPMIMSFQELYGLGGRCAESKLAEVDEELYRIP